jgi:hypothetical protein
LQAALTEQEVGILKRLGAALLSQWNDLPTCIQQRMFERSFDTVAPHEAASLKRRIARFIHNYKDDFGGAR